MAVIKTRMIQMGSSVNDTVYIETKSDIVLRNNGSTVEESLNTLETTLNFNNLTVTGMVPIANIPPAALEHLVVVANEAARFALTTAQVQLGDVVKQSDTGLMYYVVDETKLNNAGGYEVFMAGAASSVPWEGVTGKPSSYTPASHTHGNITNAGAITSDTAVANGDKIIVADSSNSSKLIRTGISFDGSTETKALTPKGTWATFNNYTHPTTTAVAAAAVKVGKDSSGHVVIGSALTYSDVGAAASSHNHSGAEITSGTVAADRLADYPEARLIWGGKNFSAGYGPIDAAMIGDLGANRFAFLKAAGITIEYSTDGGSSFSDYGSTDVNKTGLFAAGANYYLGKHSTAGTNTINDQLRVTIDTGAAGVYSIINKIAIFMSTLGNTVSVKLEKALQSTPTTYTTHLDWTGISGNSGWNILNIPGITTYGNTAASQYGRLRLTFRQTAVYTNRASALIYKIQAYGGMGWTTPSNLAKNGHLYSYDNNQIATFPAEVKVNGSSTNTVTYLTATPTTGQVVVTDGTAGGIKTTGYTIAKSVPSDAKFTDTVYTHPTTTAVAAAAVKVGNDASGHVVLGAALTASDVGAAASGHNHDSTYAAKSHAHGNVTSGGAITATGVTIANGDALVIADASATTAGTLSKTSITFDGSTTTKALTQKGTWATFNNYTHPSHTAGTAGTSSATSGVTANIPYISYDGEGHVTGSGTHTHTVPAMTASANGVGRITEGNGVSASYSSGNVTVANTAGVYSVKGTQTKTTGAWTGNIPIDALYDGLTIAYYLPYAGSGNATLNLTLKDGSTTTGNIEVYYSGTTRMTTHYAAGSTIILTYWSAGAISVSGTATTKARWTHADYQTSSPNVYNVYSYGISGHAGTNGIMRNSIIMQDADNAWQSFTTTEGTETSKTRNTIGFRIGHIGYCSNSTTIVSNTNIPSGKLFMAGPFDARYSFNCSTDTLTAYKELYLVGTINSTDGLFYLDTTWWTQTLPNTEDGKVYILLGFMYSAYQLSLIPSHPMYEYKNGAVRLWSPKLVDSAGTATTLETNRYLDGVSFNGDANVSHYATCTSTASTTALVATITPNMSVSLVQGFRVIVKFTNTITADAPTLNVNSTGAKAIYRTSKRISANHFRAGGVYEFVYDGSYWQLVTVAGDNNEIITSSSPTTTYQCPGDYWYEPIT